MPFVPEFIESGESEFLDKLMVVVHRDMKPGLDHFYLSDALPDFAAMLRGKPSEFRYPLLVLGLERMSSEEHDSGEWLSQDLRVGAGIVVKDTSIASVMRRAEKYVRVFTAVIRKGIKEMLPGPSQQVEYRLSIDHQYMTHEPAKDGGVAQGVEFEIRIQFGEK